MATLPQALRGLLIPLLPLTALAQPVSRAGEDFEFFERRIRPLLSSKCYPCHSAKTIASGGLRLDSREAVRKGGNHGPAVVPRQQDLSVLLRAVSYDDERLRMPPTGKLGDQERADLDEWIRSGAADPRDDAAVLASKNQSIDWVKARSHWAFQPFRAHPVPVVANKVWASTWIDRFVLAKLEAKGLKPAPPADKRTLIRRVTFDLIGLPPSTAEVDAFLADRSPKAFDKVVDRLLASPHHGERWARHWLDLARYAETDGHEFDREKPNAWRYRDFVIRALNEDLPYDQFIREQIAGDLVPRKRMVAEGTYWDSPAGTGFFGLGEERNAADDVAEVRADKIDNQIDTISKTFLGLTVACARCHDHKFDAIPTRDYYAMAGILEGKQVIQASLDSPDRVREAERVHSEIAQASQRIEARLRPLREEAARKPGITAKAPKAWAAELGYAAKEPDHVLYPLARLSETSTQPFDERFTGLRKELAAWNAVASAPSDNLVIADFSSGSYDGWRSDGPAFGPAPTSLVPPEQILQGYRGRAVANSYRSGADEWMGYLNSRSFRATKNYLHVRLAGTVDGTSRRQPGLVRVSLVGDGRDVTFTPEAGGRFTWKSSGLSKLLGEVVFIEISDRTRTGNIVVDKMVLSDSRETPISGRTLNRRVVQMLDDPELKSVESVVAAYDRLFAQALSKKDPDAEERWLAQTATNILATEISLTAAEKAELQSLRQKIGEPAFAMVAIEDVPGDAKLNIGGNPHNLGESVPRGFLRVLSSSGKFDHGSGRMQLANAVASPTNPLTARVIVNRIWKHHFGEGLVRTPDNFGRMGQRPTHPELLDTLAAKFVQDGWSLKSLHRTMVLSSAYRMSNRQDPLAQKIDANNRLLHHIPVRRLEGEIIRDSILAVTGALDRTLYGPSVPPHISEYQDGRGKPQQSGPLDGAGRRSVYIGVRRNFLPPIWLAFDYPMTVTSIGHRGTSTVPSQALILMNNEFVTKQAARWVDRMQGLYADPKVRLEAMFQNAYARPIEAVEVEKSLQFLTSQIKHYGESSDAEFRAWADLAHVMINSKEFIFIR